MSKTLNEIANELKSSNKKIQLIYAFNGTGKTRLSKEFKSLCDVSIEETAMELIDERVETKDKILYYNAFTEDLFYWDNDLEDGTDLKLKVHANRFISWIIEDQGRGNIITGHFQKYANNKLIPDFHVKNVQDKIKFQNEIRFSFERGNEENLEQVKISKGEESNFIWSVFYSLMELVIETLNYVEKEYKDTEAFDELEYIFIDDPITSLDDNHLIQVAVDLAQLIKTSQSNLKFIITTHNPLFYNVLHNEFNNDDKESNYKKSRDFISRRLEKFEDDTYTMHEQKSDAPFSYHLFLLREIEIAISEEKLKKFHFNYLRNLFEKTATFLGYSKWQELLPNENRKAYENRMINFNSHSKHSFDEIAALNPQEAAMFKFIFKEFLSKNNFKKSG